ncbi:hypothetical protein BS50DRAFT_603180 [Corynespora cassiicola Philippines]|uniref:Uncharacterized protein n=1 Tax=Corynespora cassiicola Philippines TaxID=1448308 RepID=A0A2T2NAL2_CORCC|nr:hypothetical protein BS50DRAFT_603180 [Corynespora cassiicola Philippines]
MPNHLRDRSEVDDYDQAPGLHRSRSGSYADHVESKAQWDRRDRERQMKRYRDRYPAHRQQPSDRLYVPTFDQGGRHRRSRSDEMMGEKIEEPARNFNVREQKPRRLQDLVLEEQPTQANQQLTVRTKPKIQVQIHQEETPSQAIARRTTKKTPSASPRSPGAQPEMLFQYNTLQNKLAEIESACTPYEDVEAADPQDLTFSKISEQVRGISFELLVWARLMNLENTGKIDRNKKEYCSTAIRMLGRLTKRVTDLSALCRDAKPRDLKYEPLPDEDDEDDRYQSYGYDSEDDNSVNDVTESKGFLIEHQLNSIQFQMKTLKRLTRPLQEATIDGEDEVVAVEKLVDEVGKYFGSEEALRQYSIDSKYAGKTALREAKYTDGYR